MAAGDITAIFRPDTFILTGYFDSDLSKIVVSLPDGRLISNGFDKSELLLSRKWDLGKQKSK